MSEHIVGVEPKVYNGKKYRSTLEASTAQLLDSLGIPYEYETKKIVLQDGFYSPFQKDKVRQICYVPDFVIGPILLETKGFETPDWIIKKKLLFKYLMENEPDTIFYMVKNNKQLLECLDKHWAYLSYYIEVTSKPTKKQPAQTKRYDSIKEALADLNMQGRSMTPIIRSLINKVDYIYGYSWKLRKIEI